MFALHNIATELIEEKGRQIYLSTTISSRVAILVEHGEMEEWMALLKKAKQVFRQYYKLDFTAAVSDSAQIQHIRKLYQETLECLSYRFYLGEGSLITKNDVLKETKHAAAISLDFEPIAMFVRSGNVEQVQQNLNSMFEQLQASTKEINIVKSHLLELYLILIRQAQPEHMNKYFKNIILFEAFETMGQMRQYVLHTAEEIASLHYESNIQTHSAMMNQVLHYIQQHLHEESMTLTKLANEIFYMNVDYLGKLFKKETGEKFSQYVMNMRMNEAKSMIESQDTVKISQIAEKVGFGNNPQYFSQVFKKVTGLSPTEYKKKTTVF